MFNKLQKLLSIVLLSLAGTFAAQASTDMVDVVYLKNGSVIRGTIVEAVTDGNIKIETADGSWFVYRTADVAYIKKEPKGKKDSGNKFLDRFDDDELYGWEQAPRYRGFVGLSSVIGTGTWDDTRTFFYTVQGLQINPYLFLGAGIGANYWDSYETWSFPVFADVRAELHKAIKRNFSPFAEVQLGYSMGDAQGLYFSPQIGMHFYFGHKKTGISAAVGYTVQHCTLDEYDCIYKNGYYDYNAEGFNLTVSFDF